MVNGKILMSGMLIILCISCTFIYDYEYVTGLVFESPEDVMHFVYTYIATEVETDGEDNWKMPDETMQDRAGDCEDRALLMMSLCDENFGDYGSLGLLRMGSIYHAVVSYGGKCYDPSFDMIRPDPEYVHEIPWELAITYAKDYH